MRGRCRRSRCGIPGEADLQEDARLAVYKLGEDANGELSPEPTRRGGLQDSVRAWSLVCFDFKAISRRVHRELWTHGGSKQNRTSVYVF